MTKLKDIFDTNKAINAMRNLSIVSIILAFLSVGVSFYIYLHPVLTSIFAVVSGGDTLDTNKIIAASTIFIGVYLVSVRPLKARKQKLS